MAKRSRSLDPKLQEALDRVGVTPQQLFDEQRSIASGAVTTTDVLNPTALRPTGVPNFLSSLWHINLDTFDRKLTNSLGSAGVGYCYMIRRKGALVHARADGYARVGDDGPIRWTHITPMNIGSVSKFVTAIATVKLLLDKDIRTTHSIIDFVPTDLNPHWSIRNVTFDQLLTHTSGLGRALNGNNGLNSNSGPEGFTGAETYLGVGSASDGQRDYKNLNFVALRILFAALLGIDPRMSVKSLGIVDTFWDLVSAKLYADFVSQNVFGPAGIAAREFDAPADSALAYATPPKAPGESLFAGSTAAGSSGWHLSIDELVRLLGTFRAGSMMPSFRTEQLLDDLYGLDQAIPTKAGTLFYKGGREWDQTTKKGIDTAIYMMPGGVDFAIFVNSVPPRASAVTAAAGGLVPTTVGAGPTGTAPPWPSHLDNIPQLIGESVEFNFF